MPILIATYLLMDRPLEPLLDALRGDWSSEDRERIEKLLHDKKRREGKKTTGNEGLKHKAEKIARLVCGSA